MSCLPVYPASFAHPTVHRRAVCGLLSLWPVAVPAQTRTARVAVLSGSSPDPGNLRVMIEPFRKILRERGHVEGQNLKLEFRFAEGRYERLPGLLQELMRSEPDVLVTIAPRPALVAKAGAPSLPIVAAAVDDPVQMGLVTSIARPGGNITGVSGAFHGLVSRRLQLLKDILPRAQRFAIVFNPDSVPRQALATELPAWERGLGVAIQLVAVREPDDVEAAFADIAKEQSDGVVVLADAVFWIHRARIGARCLQDRLPSIWGHAGYLDAGGLASYQGDFSAVMRRAAGMVDQILRGAKPGDIPFEQISKLELVVNLKGAQAIGVTIPNSVLLAADEVIR